MLNLFFEVKANGVYILDYCKTAIKQNYFEVGRIAAISDGSGFFSTHGYRCALRYCCMYRLGFYWHWEEKYGELLKYM